MESPTNATAESENSFAKENLPKHLLCLPAFLSITAFLLSLNGLFCTYVQYVSPTATEPDGSPLSIHFGYWSHQSWNITSSPNGTTELESTCEPYPYDEAPPDTMFRVGRTFNLLALVFGASFLLLDFLTGCASANKRKSVWQASGLGYLLTSFCSGMSLLIFESVVCKNNMLLGQFPVFEGGYCSLYSGSICVVAATVMWFVTACGIIAMHPWRSSHS